MVGAILDYLKERIRILNPKMFGLFLLNNSKWLKMSFLKLLRRSDW